MGIQTSLDAVRDAERIVDALRLADDLAFEANRDPGVRTIRILSAALRDDDQLVAIAATHALAQVFDEQADRALSQLLSSDRPFLREHAAWAIGSRIPRLDAIGRLIAMVVEGGFGGMLAQRTLEQWAFPTPEHIAIGLEGALLGVRGVEERYRLVETLGLVRGRIATQPLLAIAADESEDEQVRVAAVSALGQRRDEAATAEIRTFLDGLTAGGGYLADVARLALVDLAGGTAVREEPHDDLTVAQLFLHADIDADLSHAGSGDNGGIATLLVRLGDALVDPASPARVQRVITMSRGSVQGAVESVESIRATTAGHVYGRIPLLSAPVNSASAWPLRVAARRGIRRMLRAAGGVDLLHLRMADVGSLAAADVARELDVPVVFTVAPDPHAVIRSMDLAGQLTRANFGEVDENEHFWFRTRLVQRLASNAAHSVLFPRPQLEKDMRELVGIDVTSHPERHTVVPEGIDLGVVDRGVAEAAALASGLPASPALAELGALLEGLPDARRGLPLLVSVGRFHRVKGMASIVEAWATGPLRDQANLLLIGGDLEHPSVDEQEQLALMDELVPTALRLERGLLLPGHRPNDTVARWVAAARFGVPGLAAPRGVYVCGSVKEEFGIALLEAMASGLLVVAPDGGGPATYVDRGVTGILTQTWNVSSLALAMWDAFALAQSGTNPGQAEASRATVERSFTVEAMADSLVGVYDGVHTEYSAAGVA
ncbi:glycosyltransferase [Herbiconiux sp. CPCC 205716]|uniref:D-inositol 3-phosphate glycosyltransferase n=1 Tax=Herbiconiux gentiana TaxID=2970912 RepID=A0ABT2GFN8_9MICO|nr:glycosyltransferase [Herbiconiux gentiana]MCS5714105.1 glycosyltransferase [Herbiconiux gentiana]